MKRRCNCITCHEYKGYGGRGIKVCGQWSDFKLFAVWSLDNGYQDSLSIDRIDNDRGYEPSNCRWVNSKVQLRNTRKSVFITINGITKTMKDWSLQSGVKYTTLKHRFDTGITGMDLLKGGEKQCNVPIAELNSLKSAGSNTKCNILTE